MFFTKVDVIGRVLLFWLLIAGPAFAAPAAPKLLPVPAHMTLEVGEFVIASTTPVVVPPGDAGARNAALRFADLMRGQKVALTVSGERGRAPAIRFIRKAGMAPEAYRLVTDVSGAIVAASDDSGLLYGAMTLWQLASQPGAARRIPAVTIDDAPRFGWRGLMLDSARHFQSPGYIRHLIDWMAANKLNRLHWHLVDDQGWRLEIKKYPKLIDVSAWRLPATAPGAPPLPREGGFYTQAEVRGIVAYAARRGVTIVPEIEMPGHAVAAIRAYPWLGMGVPLPEGVWSDWGVFPWLYKPDERTFGFLKDVLGEVMALFPGKYIHVGGDEAVKDQWRADPAVQAKIKALGLKDEDALQGWFMARIGKYLTAHGRTPIGWDEMLEGGVPPDAAITSWRGIDGAITAARMGHDAVLSPAPTLYINNPQGRGPQEPPGRGDIVTLADVLAFDPAPTALTQAQQRHILGLQANLWTEHIRTEARAAWMTFPRAAAVAEIGWSPARKRDVPEFLARLKPQLDRMAPLGLVAANSAFVADPPPPSDMRTSRQLEPCSANVLLDLEDDYPAVGPRAHFLFDIMHPCWIWRGAPVAGARTIALDVGQLPFNFQIGADLNKIVFRRPATPAGEFEVREKGCDGPLLATLPLAPAQDNPGVTRLIATLPQRDRGTDLCVTYTARGVNPLWAIDRMMLGR